MPIPACCRRPPPRVLSLVATILLATGCGGTASGRLTARWNAREFTKPTDSARAVRPHTFSGPIEARWCRGARHLEVTSVQEDVGFGLVLYPTDSLTPGHYPAFDPGIDTARRPSASGAGRWFTEQKLLGLQSDSGGVDLFRDGDRLRARFGFRMRSLEGSDTIRVTGEVQGITRGRCPGDSVPGTTPRQ